MARGKGYYVLAVKDLDKTLQEIASGRVKMPVDNSIYPDIFANIIRRCDDVNEVKKFIRQCKLKKADFIHWWESVVEDGYELIVVDYKAPDENFIELAGSERLVRYISTARG